MVDFNKDGIAYSSPYGESQAYQSGLDQLINQLSSLRSDSVGARQGLTKRLDTVVNQFKNLYKNSVGADPTNEQIDKFISEKGVSSIVNSPLGRSENNEQGIRNDTAQYIGDTFQQEANKVAEDKTSSLTSKYGGLADEFMSMGQKSLGNLSDSLKQFSTSLFEKLRPQLNLAAQAGGYSDSGGQTLQEGGALKDLASNAESTLGGAKYDLENQANAIRFGGSSAPVSLASAFAANQPNYLATFSGNASNQMNDYYTRMIDQMNRLQLSGAQYKNMENYAENSRPSFGYSLGQNFANSTGQGLGNFFNPQTYYKAK